MNLDLACSNPGVTIIVLNCYVALYVLSSLFLAGSSMTADQYLQNYFSSFFNWPQRFPPIDNPVYYVNTQRCLTFSRHITQTPLDISTGTILDGRLKHRYSQDVLFRGACLLNRDHLHVYRR